MDYRKFSTIEDLITFEKRTANGDPDNNYDSYKNALLEKYDINIDDFKESLSGGRADGKKITDFPLDQLLIGIGIELEHTTDRFKALEISCDHLSEFSDYYTRLVSLEKDAEKEKKEATIKQAYVSHIEGHKDSQGESAPWVIKSHEDDHIISSHKTEGDAKSHLQDMYAHKGTILIPLDKEAYASIEALVHKMAEEMNQDNVDMVKLTLTPDKGTVNFKTTNQDSTTPKVSPKMGP